MAIGLLACSDRPITLQPGRLSPHSEASFTDITRPPGYGGTLWLCKTGPSSETGTPYRLQVTATGGTFQYATQNGTDNIFTLTLIDGAGPCQGGASGAALFYVKDGSVIHVSVAELLPTPNGSTPQSWRLVYDNGTQDVISTGGAVNPYTFDINTGDLFDYKLTLTNGSTPPEVCTDQNATNFGGPLPCVYPGKTFTIGPSSMEGAIRIDAGDWVNGGYSFKFKSAHTATTFTVTSFVTITGPCRNSSGQLTGTSDVLTVPMGTKVYNISASANATDWLPTGDANNVLSWAGSIVAPAGLCGGGGNSLDASKGAVYTATVSQVPPSGSLVDFRFKYRDPAAKGKPNTNCLDTSDPNRAKADVCGASWSQTVTDP
jgi:hypothetical protein